MTAARVSDATLARIRTLAADVGADPPLARALVLYRDGAHEAALLTSVVYQTARQAPVSGVYRREDMADEGAAFDLAAWEMEEDLG